MRYFLNILTICLCFLLLATGSASAFGEIRYPDRALNLRDSRSSKGKWVGSLVIGQKVRVAYIKNGWFAIFEPDETRDSEDAAVGYANSKYLKEAPVEVGKVAWGKLAETTEDANVRVKSSGLSEQLSVLKAGEKVRVDFPDDDWIMVFPANATIRSKMGTLGYAQKKKFRFLSTKAKPVTTASIAKRAKSDKRDVYTAWGKVITVKGPVQVYRERNTDSRLVATLVQGDKVRADFLKNGWYAIFKENEKLRKEYRAIGYARQSQLVTSGSQAVSLADTLAAATSVGGAKVMTDAAGAPRESIVLSQDKITNSKRPDPKPNKTAHGYEYRLLKKGQAKKMGETWITLKVFLSTTKLPTKEALEDFSTTLWKQHRRVSKNLAVLVYLPGMDTEDLSYGVVQFSDERHLETWVRRTTLFGTKFE